MISAFPPYLKHQAVKIDPMFSETFTFKGQIFTAQEAHDQALIAFSQANRIEKDMASFTGEKRCCSFLPARE